MTDYSIAFDKTREIVQFHTEAYEALIDVPFSAPMPEGCADGTPLMLSILSVLEADALSVAQAHSTTISLWQETIAAYEDMECLASGAFDELREQMDV